jgi:hypothetical protein
MHSLTHSPTHGLMPYRRVADVPSVQHRQYSQCDGHSVRRFWGPVLPAPLLTNSRRGGLKDEWTRKTVRGSQKITCQLSDTSYCRLRWRREGKAEIEVCAVLEQRPGSYLIPSMPSLVGMRQSMR